MLDCIMCISNTGILERGWIGDGHWYTIDNIVLKMKSGKRLKRYAVCVDGCWKSNQQMTLREARAEVSRLQEETRAAKYYAMNI